MAPSIALNIPSRYAPTPSASSPPQPSSGPALDWLTTTWTVTHSTLSMWRSARNVRITYTSIPGSAAGAPRLDDLVSYEPTSKEGVLKTVTGIDTQNGSSNPGWDWRGKGMLFFVTSHWEVLGWGEATTKEGVKERWAVTWFAPTLFTKEGVDVYCDRKEGISEETYGEIQRALVGLDGAKKVAELVEKDMQPVEIRLPWLEQ